LKDTIEEDLSGLSFMEKAKALAHFGSNVSKLTDGLSKCKDLPASAK